MSDEPRSTKAAQARLAAKLRAEHKTWVDVAEHFARCYRVNMRVAFRLAHGWSQRQAAEQWNERWPDEPKTLKSFSYWENWPSSTGHEPSLRVLERLAQLYECRPGDLLSDRADYRHLDKEAGRLEPAGAGGRNDLPAGTDAGPDGGCALTPAGGQAPDNLAALVLYQLEAMTTAAGAGLRGSLPGSPRERDHVFDNLVRFLTAWAHTMRPRRREVLQMLGWAAAAAAAAPLTEGLSYDEQVRVVAAIQTPSRVDASVVGHIEEVLRLCIRQDAALGPQAVLDTVLAQRNLVRAMLPECSAGLRPRLLSLFSNLSCIAGWCSFDLTDFDSAAYFYEQARSGAHEAENIELGMAVLGHMSELATWQGRPRVGIDHAVAAQAWAKRTDDPKLQAYTFDVAARAYASDGQHGACLTELENAERMVATVSERDSAPASLLYAYGPGALASTQSLCFLQLADPVRVVQSANTSLALLDSSLVRVIAFTKLDLVGAYTQQREVEHAAEMLGDTAALVVRNRSVRLVRQLRDSRTQLEPWERTRAVRTLDDKLTAYGLAGNGST